MLLALVVHCRLYRRDRIIPLLVMGPRTVALVVAWPYYPFLELGSTGDAAYSGVMDVMYEHPWWRVIAALPGFVVVIQRFRRDRTDALALMLFGGAGASISSAPSPTSTASAVRPAADHARRAHRHRHPGRGLRRAPPRRRSVPWIAWLSVSFAIGLVGVAPGFARFVPRPLLPSSLRDRTALQPITSLYDGLDERAARPAPSSSRQRNRQPELDRARLRHVRRVPGLSDRVRQGPADASPRLRDVPRSRRRPRRRAPRSRSATGSVAVLCSTNQCARDVRGRRRSSPTVPTTR